MIFFSLQFTLPAHLGEWSIANTDCQKYLEGGYQDPYIPSNSKPETCAYYNGDFANYDEGHK